MILRSFQTRQYFWILSLCNNDKLRDWNSQPKWLLISIIWVYLDISREQNLNVSYIINIKTVHIHLQYHCIYDDGFTTVNATKDGDKIKIWPGLYKNQPNSKSLVNQLYYIKTTVELKLDPRLNVMDVSPVGTSSSNTVSLVENQ